MKRYFLFILLLPIQLFCKSTPDSLQVIDLQHKNLSKLPVGINFTNLKALHIGFNPITEIPIELSLAKYLSILSINSVNNFDIEKSIQIIKNLNLQYLSLNNANLMFLPLEFGQIKSLRHLSLSNNYIKEIPGYIFKNANYQSLDLSNNIINDLPEEIGSQENLQTLNLDNNPCINNEETYKNLHKLQNLSSLSLKGASILSTGIWNLKTIKKLDISEGTFATINTIADVNRNGLEYLQADNCDNLDFTTLLPILASQGLKTIIIGGDKNTGFNNTIISPNLIALTLVGKTLEHFSFSNTPSNLTDLNINFSNILCETELINTLTKCHNLKNLNLSNCNLNGIPPKIKDLKNLETLNLSGNKLTSVNELMNLKQLLTLDISLCGLSETQLEKLKKELPNTNIINNDVYKKLPLGDVLPKTETFTVSSSVPQKLITENGTEITIPKNSLVYPNGKPVKENVSIDFTSYYSLGEIAASGINMNYEAKDISAPFSSAGMFNITAKANGENLQLKKGSEIQIAFQSNDPDQSYNYYSYDNEKRNWKEFGKDSIKKIKIEKTEDTTRTAETVLSSARNIKYPVPSEFYKYKKITINWHLNHKNKPDGTFSIVSLFEKPENALDTTKNENYFNEIKTLAKYTWKVDATRFSNEIYSRNKLFHNTEEKRVFKFLNPRYMHSTTIEQMDVEFELAVDKENDNFIFKFYNEVDTVLVHAYPSSINGKNPDRIQKTIKKMYFDYAALEKERKKVTNIRKRKFEMAYANYKNNLAASRGMISQLNNQNSNFIFNRRTRPALAPVRRLISIMSLGVINCDVPIIVEKPITISPEFYIADGSKITNGVYQVIDPRYNIVLSYYQPENIKVSKRTILTFLYNSGTSNQVFIGKLNTFDLSNRHGKVKVILAPLNSAVTEGQLSQAINSNN